MTQLGSTFLTSGRRRGRKGAASAGLYTSLLMLWMITHALRLIVVFRSRSARTCARTRYFIPCMCPANPKLQAAAPVHTGTPTTHGQCTIL